MYANVAFFVLSCIVGTIVGVRQVFQSKVLPSSPKLLVIFLFLGGLIFAYLAGRLNGGLFHLLFQGGDWRKLAHGGFVSFGAILGALGYGFLLSKIFKAPSGEILDIIALIFPLMESIYRVGCVLMGCCYGRVTDGFGGVYLPEIHGVWAYRYPTQLMLLLFNLTLFLFLWKTRPKRNYLGMQTLHLLIIYSIGRFLIDTLRADLPVAGFFSYHQITSMVIFSLASIVYLKPLFDHSK